MGEVALPVARVYVDLGLPHLDRPFDYAVPEEMDETAVPGARVRVRFAGRLLDGFVVERAATTDQQKLAPLTKAVSAEPVLPPHSIELVRAVADHYAGTFSDVARLAVPARHAATEAATPRDDPAPPDLPGDPGPLSRYPAGPGFLDALRQGGSPRAGWTVVPVEAEAGDWAAGFVAAASATVASGRSVVVVVPDAHDVARVAPLLESALGKSRVARQMADLGPSARYRSFLRGLRGQATAVVGTRSAVFAPVIDLGLICLWDDGDDLHAELRSPYPHARDVAAIRASQRGAGLLLGSYARTCEVQALIDREWLAPVQLTPDETRRLAPAVRITGDDDYTLDRDPMARAARLPREAFALVRTGLTHGPVLVQVPRAGYLAGLSCAACGERARCPACAGPLRSASAINRADSHVSCGWCARIVTAWACAECRATRLRSGRVGSERTAEELGRAFPGIVVKQSSQSRVLESVTHEIALVVATPGAEPRAEGGYAAALLLDTPALLARPDLRATEEALRRWLRAAALVRPAADGGSVLAVGPQDSRALQALVRLDPGGFAVRELAERADAGFPPAVRFVAADGEWGVLTELAAAVGASPGVATLGPAPGPDDETARLFARGPVRAGADLTRAVQTFLAGRSSRKDTRSLRVTVDPAVLE